jgi:hypothetical protein
MCRAETAYIRFGRNKTKHVLYNFYELTSLRAYERFELICNGEA